MTRSQFFGAYIGRLRAEKGLSQDDVAKLVGTSKTTISNLENGISQDFKVSTLIGLSVALRVPVQTLVLAYQGRDPDKENPDKKGTQEIKDILQKALEELEK